MARKAFFSFHYKPDASRAAQVRNMGMVEGNTPVSDNDWETVTKGGDAAIKKWISGQMHGRSCTVVLVGSKTANRKWINHEIVRSWDDKMGVFGIQHPWSEGPGWGYCAQRCQPVRLHQLRRYRKEALVDCEVLHPTGKQQQGTIRLD